MTGAERLGVQRRRFIFVWNGKIDAGDRPSKRLVRRPLKWLDTHPNCSNSYMLVTRFIYS